MRILFVVHGFPPDALGGTEIYTEGIARAMRETFAEEVFVITREADEQRPEYAVREYERHGLTVFSINNNFSRCQSFAETYRSPAIRLITSRLVDRIEPDIVHIQHLTCLSTELVLELGQRRIPTVFTLNDYWLICHRGQLLDTNLERCEGPQQGCDRCVMPHAGLSGPGYSSAAALAALVGRLPGGIARPLRRIGGRVVPFLGRRANAADAGLERSRHMLDIAGRTNLFLAPSQTLRDHFIRFGVPAERVRHIHQGIDHGPLEDLKHEPSDRLRIGFLGSMMASKAPHILLEAFALLPEGAATLEIFGGFAAYHGDDSYRQEVEPLLDRPGVNHHGSLPHDQVAKAFAAIDVLVVPSIWLENAPFVIREAFIAGTPPIVTDHGGMAEMVRHDVDGLRFTPGDPHALSDALRRFLTEPDLLERLRGGAPQVMTINEDATQLRSIYDDLLAQPVEEVPSGRMAAVVLNYCTPQDTMLAVRSLQSAEAPPEHIIVVDNHGGDGSVAFFENHIHDCEIHETQSNLGFSGGCNTGILRALELGAQSILLVNGDIVLSAHAPGLLQHALDEDEGVGIAAPLVLNRNDPARIDSAGMMFHRLTGRMRHRLAGARHQPEMVGDRERVAAAMGCAMLIDRKVFETIGLLDEDYFFSFEDLDYCLRAKRAGMETVVIGDAIAYHAGSQSIGPRSPARLYYATRNHLLAAQRAAPLPAPLALGRATIILGLNLAFAARSGWVSLGRGTHECLRGAWHHIRGRYGEDRT